MQLANSDSLLTQGPYKLFCSQTNTIFRNFHIFTINSPQSGTFTPIISWLRCQSIAICMVIIQISQCMKLSNYLVFILKVWKFTQTLQTSAKVLVFHGLWRPDHFAPTFINLHWVLCPALGQPLSSCGNKLRERGRLSKNVYVRVFHDLELLRYVLCCALGRQL